MHEMAVLSSCKASDFTVGQVRAAMLTMLTLCFTYVYCADDVAATYWLQVLGVGQMGMVVRVKCTKAGHPQPDKEYALKVVFNFGATTYSAVRNLYTAEFEAVSSIPRHRNITPYWAQFRDTIPPAVRCRGACTHRRRAGLCGFPLSRHCTW